MPCRSASGELLEKRLQLVLDLAADDHARLGGHPAADPGVLEPVQQRRQVHSRRRARSPCGRAARDRRRARLVVEVADTGIGIEPDVLADIFDAFQQGEQTITRRFGGLGLGLAISKAIVELHGGRLAAASDGTGQGSVFSVRLPVGDLRAGAADGGDRRPAAQPRRDRRPSAGGAGAPHPARGGPRRHRGGDGGAAPRPGPRGHRGGLGGRRPRRGGAPRRPLRSGAERPRPAGRQRARPDGRAARPLRRRAGSPSPATAWRRTCARASRPASSATSPSRSTSRPCRPRSRRRRGRRRDRPGINARAT